MFNITTCSVTSIADTKLKCAETIIIEIIPHQVFCWIPREWLSFSWDALQKVLKKKISKCYLECGRAEGSAICINGVTARLQLHSQIHWIKRELDVQTRPNLKDYFGFRIPCVCCKKL
ncbi:GSCOCT00014205001.2-RA-CDS [Cotesia congregata]|uniref:Cc_bv6.10_28.8 n=2 Tax=root TaxID=1 RepID=S6D9K3_COTCN|nr:GSCOCT00014205001.2-RA-CDS [Cotesia congregata]CAG5092476.1 cc_bv6.10_28.8 [Cotesia congregata]CCB96403.1 hypothetical protein BV6-10 [Bracoviriform congregatae]CCQ71210.1 hypothetical protein BV6-10 [Cotesia congregata]